MVSCYTLFSSLFEITSCYGILNDNLKVLKNFTHNLLLTVFRGCLHIYPLLIEVKLVPMTKRKDKIFADQVLYTNTKIKKNQYVTP